MILKVIKVEENSEKQALVGLRSERSDSEEINVLWYVPIQTIRSYWLGQKFEITLAERENNA